MKQLKFIASFLLVSFMAVGLQACVPTSSVKPVQELSQVADAYVVRDSIVIARKVLNDARALGKISKASYDTSWATTESADKIVTDQIKSAHNGMVVKSELESAKKKLADDPNLK